MIEYSLSSKAHIAHIATLLEGITVKTPTVKDPDAMDID